MTPSRLRAARLALLPLGLLALAGCSPLGLVNGLVSSAGFVVHRDLAYGGLERQRLDVYTPRGAKGAPVVVFVHGGYWHDGDKADYPFLAEALTGEGFAVVAINYRLAPTTVFPGFVEDAALAVRWVKENAAAYGGDPGRVYLMGHSAGAHIAALVALDEGYLRAVGLGPGTLRAAVGVAGPYDFLPFSPSDVRTRLAMGPEEGWPRTQPIAFVDGREPPMLLVQGGRDATVDPRNATRLAARIRERGGTVELRLYDGLDHATALGTLSRLGRLLEPRALPDLVAFLRAH